MPLQLITAPAANAVSDAEVYAHLRVPLLGSPALPADQSIIATYVAAAIGWLDGVDGILGRALIAQKWKLVIDDFPPSDGVILLPLAPLQKPDGASPPNFKVEYIDTDGMTQTLASSKYQVDHLSEPARLRPAENETWPDTDDVQNTVTITFTAGYGAAASDVPAPLRAALLLTIEDLYVNRASQVRGETLAMNDAVRRLIAPFRVYDNPSRTWPVRAEAG